MAVAAGTATHRLDCSLSFSCNGAQSVNKRKPHQMCNSISFDSIHRHLLLTYKSCGYAARVLYLHAQFHSDAETSAAVTDDFIQFLCVLFSLVFSSLLSLSLFYPSLTL